MTTYTGKSAFPENHPLAIGAGGAALSPGIFHFLPSSDLIFSIGSSFFAQTLQDRSPVSRPAKTLIQCTSDPNDLGMEYAAIACGLVGDAKLVLAQLVEEVRRQLGSAPRPTSTIRDEIAEAKRALRASIPGTPSSAPRSRRSIPTG